MNVSSYLIKPLKPYVGLAQLLELSSALFYQGSFCFLRVPHPLTMGGGEKLPQEKGILSEIMSFPRSWREEIVLFPPISLSQRAEAALAC